MGLEDVYGILCELGGVATTKQISQKAKERFPDCALWSYVGHTLRKLQTQGYVTKTQLEDRQVLWKVIDDYP